mgnify:CR=1 FL=1
MHKRTLLGAAALAALSALPLPALSQDKPPLKIVVGFPPGGSADLLARLMAELNQLSVSLRLLSEQTAASPSSLLMGHPPLRPGPGETPP